jgi:hypothetical protein
LITLKGIENKGREYDPMNGYISFERTKLLHRIFVEEEITFDEVKKRADYYGLPILYAYTDYPVDQNEVAHMGFQIAFLVDAQITNDKANQVLQRTLKFIFPESHPRNDDVAGVYFDDPLLKYYDKSIPEISIEALIRNMTICLRDRFGDTNYKQKIKNFAKRNGLKLTSKGLIDIDIITDPVEIENELNYHEYPDNSDHKNSPSSFILYNNINGEKLYKINLDIENEDNNNSISHKKKYRIHNEYRSEDIDLIRPVCQLFREFESGGIELGQSELQGLASTLCDIESGSKLFLDILDKHSHYKSYADKYDYWSKTMSYMNQMECDPTRCDLFCPYKSTCNHSKDILSTTKPKRRTVVKLLNYAEPLYSTTEALDDFRENFLIAYDASDTNIHVLNGPVGVGKTTIITDFMADNPNLKLLVACSTNELKEESYNKVKDKISVVKSPSLYESKHLLPSRVWNTIESLYLTRKHNAVYEYIKKVIIEKKVDHRCIEILKSYLRDIKSFYTSDCHAFTTHSRLLTLDYWFLMKYDAIIIDEDVLLNCMIPNQIEILITEFHKILDQIDTDYKLAKKIRTALRAAGEKSLFTLERIDHDEAYDGISTAIDIPSFCQAEKFYSKKKSDENDLLESYMSGDSIIFFKPLKLDHRIKYIMLSATADQRICNYAWGANRVRFYDCKQAKYSITLNQYTDRTMSRSDIDKNPGIVDRITNWTGIKKRITFKRFCKNGDRHFGKTTGVNELEGQDINVIGTPHQPEFLYKLIAHTFGHDVVDDAKMRYQLIRHKGFAFWFMTFDRELLKNIQLWMIESELLQAIGRARPLREECTVNVFSNLPLHQAVMKESDYE